MPMRLVFESPLLRREVIKMDEWVKRIAEERRRALNRREIEAAISEVKGNGPDDPAWREWYRAIVRRGRKDGCGEREER